jgi:hypothetical protein
MIEAASVGSLNHRLEDCAITKFVRDTTSACPLNFSRQSLAKV